MHDMRACDFTVVVVLSFSSLPLFKCFSGADDDAFVDRYDCLGYGSDVDGWDEREY